MDYEEFYMNIENKSTVIVLRTAQGKTPKTYQGTIAQDTLIVATIKFFHRCLAEGHIMSLDELKVLGSYLYKLLFDANISSVFKEDFDKIDREDNSTSRLRVTLEFKEAAADPGDSSLGIHLLPGRTAFSGRQQPADPHPACAAQRPLQQAHGRSGIAEHSGRCVKADMGLKRERGWAGTGNY